MVKKCKQLLVFGAGGQIRDLEGFHGARAQPLDLANTNIRANTTCAMSRQQFAEAVLSNILYYYNSTKNSRLGNDIACRNFIMRVAFHPRGFTNSGFSYRTSER